MLRFSFILSAAFVATVVAGQPWLTSALAADPTLTGCLVKLEEDVDLPAQEPGLLTQLTVKEGSQVRQGDVLGKIYDSEAQSQKKAAEFAVGAAYKQATDDVQIRYAQKSAEVAKKDYEMMLESNRTAAKAVPEIEVLKKKLEWDAAILSAEKAAHDRDLAKYEYHTKKAERDIAQLAIDRRTIAAPFDGEVVKIYRHQDEWVGPGDPILRLVRLDTVLVEGFVKQAEFDPHEVQDRDVVVEITMARGRKEQATGRIVYVQSMVDYEQRYIVRAEVTNRQEYGRWLLRDGMKATMTIRLDSSPAVNVTSAP
jgi:multidrug efflux pump subunit AcrA (membrane-fusion protein)